MPNIFYDDNALLDLRYLVAAEPFENPDDPDGGSAIGCLLEVGHTPQTMSFHYPTRERRDFAFARLIALHQAHTAATRAPQDEDA